MPVYASIQVKISEEQISEIKDALSALVTRFVSHGYCYRRGYVWFVTSEEAVFHCTLTGVDSYQVSRSSDAIRDYWIDLESYARSKCEIRHYTEVDSDRMGDQDYVDSIDGCDAFVLSCDPILGSPSLVEESTQRMLGVYRLELPFDVIDLLWHWEREYDAVFSLWLSSEEYEKWAHSQLRDSMSELNVKGQRVAKQISEALLRPVKYELHRCIDD